MNSFRPLFDSQKYRNQWVMTVGVGVLPPNKKGIHNLQKLENDDKTKPKAASIEHVGLPLGTHEVTRKSLEEERKAAYQDFVLKVALKIQTFVSRCFSSI